MIRIIEEKCGKLRRTVVIPIDFKSDKNWKIIFFGKIYLYFCDLNQSPLITVLCMLAQLMILILYTHNTHVMY